MEKKPHSSDNTNKLIFGGLVVVVVMSVISFLVGFAFAYSQVGGTGSPISNLLSKQWFTQRDTSNGDLNLYWKVYDILQQQYVDESKLDKNKLFYGSISGMVNAIGDPATLFFSPEETTSYEKSQAGLYEGVGIELGTKDGFVVVISAFEGSPAKTAGIQIGDKILKVDSTSLEGKTVFDAVKLIRGEAGTEVTLTVARAVNGSVQTKEYKMKRNQITSPSMQFEGVDKNGIARVNVYRFTDSTLNEWEKNWNSMVTEIKKQPVKGLVIDLRGNPGGFLQGAVYMAEDFLPEGKTVVYQDSRLNEYRAEHRVSRQGRLLDVPVVIMVNEGSASASEIFTGAMQVYKRATVVGVKSYGKGTAQIIIPFEQDGSSLHITVSKWLLPDKRWIQSSDPITPDDIVEAKQEDLQAGKDAQYQEALKKLQDMVK